MIKILWFIFLLLVPFYFFDSGGFQLAHIPLILLFSMLIIRRNFSPAIKAFIAFAMYAVAVNLVYAIFTSLDGELDISFLFSSAIIIFNIMTVYVAYNIVEVDKNLNYTFYGLAIAGLAQLGAFAFLGFNYGGARYLAFFNDPNQLSAWSLFAIIICAIASANKLKSGPLFLGVLGILSALVLLSASRGGVLSLMVMFIIIFWDAPAWIKVALGLAFVAVLAFFLVDIQEAYFFQRLQGLSEMGAGEMGESRHWERVWEFPEYNLLGAGSGGVYRFHSDTETSDGEIHSLPLTLIFCYGVPGLILYFRFLMKCTFISKKVHHLLFFIPPFLGTCMSQNTIRFIPVYVAFAISAAILDKKRQRERIATATKRGLYERLLLAISLRRARQSRF